MNQYAPKNNPELVKMIHQEIQKNGVGADLNHIDVYRVIGFENIFNPKVYPITLGFAGDVSNWLVPEAINMKGMFENSVFNGNISRWNVSSVKNMERMFKNSKFNQDISEWNVSSVKNMGSMFAHSIFNQPLGNWKVSSVQTFNAMFLESDFDQDLSDWDFSKRADYSDMFRGSLFNSDLPLERLKEIKSSLNQAYFEIMFQESRIQREMRDYFKKTGESVGELAWDQYRVYRFQKALELSMGEVKDSGSTKKRL